MTPSRYASADAGLLIGTILDQPVAQAVDVIRRRYCESWTLASLAAHVGRSRTALSTRFKRLIGDSPAHYLTRCV